MSKRPVRNAATVLLLRDGEDGLEVFMERRHLKTDFVGGAYVFPGGSVDPEDRLDERLCGALSDEEASRRLGLESGGLTYWVAAARECFEEAGVLLATTSDGENLDLSEGETATRFRSYRDELNAGNLRFSEILEREGLRLATDRIAYWAHWITPEGMPKRFDTRFFVAELPEGQTAVHDDSELVSSAWVEPATALDNGISGTWTIILPTLKNLELLSRHTSAHQALEAARSRAETPCIVPRVLEREGDARVVLPGDEGYDEADRDASVFGPEVWAPARLVRAGTLSRPE